MYIFGISGLSKVSNDFGGTKDVLKTAAAYLHFFFLSSRWQS